MMACLHTERASGFRWEVSAIWLLGLRQNAKTESDTVNRHGVVAADNWGVRDP